MDTPNKYNSPTLFDAEEDNTAEDEAKALSGPFDLDAIDVDISVVNLGYLLDRLQYDEIDLTPEFQRSSDLWTAVEKSRLIESVLLGLPLPSFYFSEDAATGKTMIIDGLQRLCALKDFWITKTLRLQGLQFLTYFEGYTADDLERSYVRRLQSLKVTLNTVRKDTPIMVKYIIFQRVNTAGKPLNPQEIRNALYQKTATDLLRRMATSEAFLAATDHRVSSRRMADRNVANRFAAFYLQPRAYDGALESYMGDALAYINAQSPERVEEIYTAFCRSMEACHQLLGSRAFRRPNPNKPSEYLTFNKALFDALSVSLARLSSSDLQTLLERKTQFVAAWNSLFDDAAFVQAVTQSTAKMPQVQCRFDKIQQLIQNLLHHDTEDFTS